MKEDTIAAIATPPGVGAISVIRVSGPESIFIVDKIFVGANKISDSNSHTIHYGKIMDESNNIVDDVLVSVFREPNSYTGENSVEISTHGSPFIAQKIVEVLLKLNVRAAEAGEFTKRAFLNSKLDLSQAEAVADVIRSRTDVSLRGARNQLDGALSKKVGKIRETLINSSSFVELELDFAEEDIEFVDRTELKNNLSKIRQEVDALLSTYSFGRIIRDGVNIAIVGLPNVGKSSLLNYLLKESRAIVSKIPGTTRDIIREEVSLDGILLKLFDTAGIRSSENEIEKEGIERSRKSIKEADLILFLGDVEQGFSSELEEELRKINETAEILKVLNKIDLDSYSKIDADVKISLLDDIGLNILRDKIKKNALADSSFSENSAIISNIRHYNCLQTSSEHLLEAELSINQNLSGEFIAANLRNAEQSLAEIIGEVTSEDILNNIFSKFCIGK